MKSLVRPALLLGVSVLLAVAQSPKPVRVLFLVGGQYHDYHQLPPALARNLHRQLSHSIDADFTITKDLATLRKDELAKYDAVMINVCEQTPLSSEEKTGLLDSIRDGLPLVALHCTFWSFQDWPEFKRVLGAFVPGHGKFGSFCLTQAHADSLILQGTPKRFELTDEPYKVDERDPSNTVLVRTCKSVQGRPGTEPEVWTRTYGKGRIFSMTFGPDSRAQQDPNYQKLLANGLLWALGRIN